MRPDLVSFATREQDGRVQLGATPQPALRAVQILGALDIAAAGPSYSVTRLGQALAVRGVPTELLSTGAPSDAVGAGMRTRTFAREAEGIPLIGRLAVSGKLRRAIEAAIAPGTVLHSHGLWVMPAFYPAWSARRRGVPHVISPRGMLGPAALQFSRRRKQLVWHLAQGQAVERAACLHATSMQEHDELRALGLKAPIAIVPNGIDMPSHADLISNRARREGRTRTVLHLGRIHPKKGIDRLLEAWARLEPSQHSWRLRIVGPSEGGHRKELAARAATLGLGHVTFEEPLFGAAKDAAYRGADLFVLPTLNENFGMVVAEALSNGRPVICTKGAPWQGLDGRGCGWWIDHGVDPLASTLAEAMAMPVAALDAMGDRGRAWMAADFSWDRIAADMEQVYRWCLAGGEPPAVVERPT